MVRPLQWATRFAVRFPWTTLGLAVAITITAVGLTATRLGFRNSRADLLNPRSEYHQRWLAYTEEFGDREDVVVVVEGSEPARVQAALRDTAATIRREDRLFQAVLYDIDLSRLRQKGLHYLSVDQLAGIEAMLQRAAPMLAGNWSDLNLGSLARRVGERLGQLSMGSAATGLGAQIAELDRFSQTLAAALGQRDGYQSAWSSFSVAGVDFGRSCCPLVSEDGHRGLVALRLAQEDKQSFDPHTRGLAALRRIVGQLEARHPGVEIGLTGLPVIENDEMQASQNSMARASVLSLVGVGIVFLAGFGGLRHPLIGNLALLFGMAWSFGFAAVAIGHLNILSSAFGAILIGQGIDFGVYYLAGYLQQRRGSATSAEALVQTAGTVGPGIATGAMSTAIAFFAAGFTEFSGVAELGTIAGGGILLCFLAAVLLLPAMLQLSDARRPAHAMPNALDLDIFLKPLYSRPNAALLIGGVATIFAAFGLSKLWYDHNLMNLQPEGLESVRLGQQLATESNQGAYFALSMADSREQAIARKEALLKLPSVDRVDEIASAMPAEDQERSAAVVRIHAALKNLPSSVPQIPTAPPEEMRAHVAALLQSLPAAPELTGIRERLGYTLQALDALPAAEYYARLSDYQQAMAGDLLARLHAMKSAADPQPPAWSDLPEGLTARFVGHNGKHLLKIYSRGDIWDMAATERFVREVRSVDPDATGNPLQIYEASRQMKRSYEEAAMYALAIVFVVVYLDFRSLRYTLLALAPLAISVVQMFGLMGLLNIPLNPANMIVLPLILGIGVDNGVHIVHDFRRQRSEGGRYRIGTSTVNAVVINSLGNMVGFGSLMIASHQGLQSLGRVLTIGMGCCLVSALLMPNLFVIFCQPQPQGSSVEPDIGPDAPEIALPNPAIAPAGRAAA
ncbi:MAG: MMPL family transporter [Planctomycetota bacterium]